MKVGLGISRTNADSQWNPGYKAFHRIHHCGNEVGSNVNVILTRQNMRPAQLAALDR